MGRPEKGDAPDARQKILRLTVATSIPLSVSHHLLDDETTKAMGDKNDVAAFKAGFGEEARQNVVGPVRQRHAVSAPIGLCGRITNKPQPDSLHVRAQPCGPQYGQSGVFGRPSFLNVTREPMNKNHVRLHVIVIF